MPAFTPDNALARVVGMRAGQDIKSGRLDQMDYAIWTSRKERDQRIALAKKLCYKYMLKMLVIA